MASRFKELKAQYDAAKLNMSKRKVHEFLEKLFQLAENMESANDYADGVISELIDRQKAEIAELNQQLDNLEYNRKVKVPAMIDSLIGDYWADNMTGSTSKDKLLSIIIEDWRTGFNGEYWHEGIWIEKNFCEFVDAVRHDYEVDEEPKYYVEIPLPKQLNGCGRLGQEKGGRLEVLFTKISLLPVWKTKFTEQEIKDIDERYWPFAVPVEEVKHEDN